MKRITVMFILLMISCVPAVTAQDKKENVRASSRSTETVTLSARDSSHAFATPQQRFSIADATINALNEQSAGYSTLVSSSGIVGMPKRAYGFYNGKLLLRKTTALSSGTMYGSGSVGTGTSITGVGAGENSIGVNGKSPYAGTSLWGSRVLVTNPLLTGSNQRRQ